MEPKELQYLDQFEGKLQVELLRLCTEGGYADGVLLETEDLDELWNKLAPNYMADAVPEIPSYPMVAIAWASYLGLAGACGWDYDWDACAATPYQAYYGEKGFDDMDDHIMTAVLGLKLESTEAKGITAMICSCAEAALSQIRHEQIERQSVMAFHVFARAARVMFRIGVSIELKRLGYKFEKVEG